MEAIITLFIVLPLAAAFLNGIIGKFYRPFGKYAATITFLILTIISVFAIATWNRQSIVYTIGGWEPVNDIPIGIDLVFDGFSAFIIGIINFIAFLSTFYAIGYIKKYTSEAFFYTLLLLMIAGMNGVVLSGDLFNIYVFVEIASIASYALVAFGVNKEELEASFKYQVLGGLASLIILLSIGLIYWLTSTLNIADISRLIATSPRNGMVLVAQVLFLAGFGLKAAVVPFHTWLPDAHSSAPSPISSLLSGVLIKAVGIYALIRLFFNMFVISYEMALLFTILGVLSIVVGGILAIGQWDYKRLLAYSSISQVGYIITGVSIGMLVLSTNGDKSIATLAIFGGLFHLLNHAVFKSLLFMTAGAVEHATGTRDLRELSGLAKYMPVTSATSFSGSMSISGLPPFSGFFSKLIIIIAAVQAQYYLVAFIAAVMSIVTLAYFLKFYKGIFSSNLKDSLKEVKEVPFTMKFPMVVLGVLCVLLSMMVIPSLREIFLNPATDSLIESADYLTAILNGSR